MWFCQGGTLASSGGSSVCWMLMLEKFFVNWRSSFTELDRVSMRQFSPAAIAKVITLLQPLPRIKFVWGCWWVVHSTDVGHNKYVCGGNMFITCHFWRLQTCCHNRMMRDAWGTGHQLYADGMAIAMIERLTRPLVLYLVWLFGTGYLNINNLHEEFGKAIVRAFFIACSSLDPTHMSSRSISRVSTSQANWSRKPIVVITKHLLKQNIWSMPSTWLDLCLQHNCIMW